MRSLPTSLPTEAECQRTIIEAAQLLGWRVHAERTSRTASGRYATAIQGDRGFPDLVLARGTKIFFVELKRDKTGRIGPGQQEWYDALNMPFFGDALPEVRAFIVWVPSQMNEFIGRLR